MAEKEKRVVLITGAGSGIGRAVALRFAAEGCFLYLTGRREKRLADVEEAVRAQGGQARAIPADVSRLDQTESLVKAIREETGYLDILVNAAGNFSMGLLHETSEADFEAGFTSNVKALWLTSKLAVPLLRGRDNSNIINVSSIAGTRSDPGMGIYQASKAAVNSLTKVMAKELAQFKIRVNAIAPGPVDTGLYSGSILGDDVEHKRLRDEMLNSVPFGRMGTPEEVARLAVFLASPESDFISGSITSIDGAMGY
jgi:NAD(P)-dependent dehydrogenase (short-subunit alcohol dehydrogenase family)